MTMFASNVFQCFDNLVAYHRFVPVKVGAGRHFAALVRQETEDVYVYVFVSDGRPSSANVDVDVWIAPPSEPGDGLDRLYVGYKVRIGSEYEVDDSFFVGCQSRIIHFLSSVSALVPVVSQELVNPCIRTKRWAVYEIERSALATLLSKARGGDMSAIAAVDVAGRLAAGKGSIARLEDSIAPIAGSLLAGSDLDEHVARFFDKNESLLTSCLASHLYVRALGSVSTSGRF